MKIVLVMIIIGFFMSPLQQAKANYGASKSQNMANARKAATQAKNTKQDYKVKNRQQAAQMVKKRFRAKVVSIQFNKLDGSPVYKAKLLGNDGVVFYVFIDANSGQMRRR